MQTDAWERNAKTTDAILDEEVLAARSAKAGHTPIACLGADSFWSIHVPLATGNGQPWAVDFGTGRRWNRRGEAMLEGDTCCAAMYLFGVRPVAGDRGASESRSALRRIGHASEPLRLTQTAFQSIVPRRFEL